MRQIVTMVRGWLAACGESLPALDAVEQRLQDLQASGRMQFLP